MMFDFDPQVSSMPLNPLERRDNTCWWHSWMGNRTIEDTPWVTDGASAFKAPLNSGMEAGFRLMAAENRLYPVRSKEMHHAVDAVLNNGIAPVLFHGVVNLKDGDDEVDYGLFTTQDGIFISIRINSMLPHWYANGIVSFYLGQHQ